MSCAPRSSPAAGRGAPAVALSVYASAGRSHVTYVRRHLRRALKVLPRCDLVELSVALVGDARMSQLHVEFMALNGPTDVLTFPLETDARGRPVSGEMVICVPEAQRQARARKIPVERELLLYAIHGLLHLSGFDDRTAAGFRKMHRTEDMILSRLGLEPTFAAAGKRQGDPGRGGRK